MKKLYFTIAAIILISLPDIGISTYFLINMSNGDSMDNININGDLKEFTDFTVHSGAFNNGE